MIPRTSAALMAQALRLMAAALDRLHDPDAPPPPPAELTDDERRRSAEALDELRRRGFRV